MTKHVLMYPDGSCRFGQGGWAAVFSFNNTEKVLYGSAPDTTTNNRMELTACIEGLNHLKTSCFVSIYTDSQYVQQGITTWIKKWKKRNWRTANKKPVLNKDLWQELVKAEARHKVIWNWIPGHGDSRLNNIADEYAGNAGYARSPRTLEELTK